MQVVTGKEMRIIEEQAQNTLGISSLILMENAGSRIVEVLKEEYGSLQHKRIHILTGMGNNGGDGLVVARQLLLLGARPKVYLIGNPQKASPEHKINLEILLKLGIDIVEVELGQLAKLKFSLNFADLILDCLFGTGFQGKLSSELEALVNLVNELERPLVAIDVPSGVDATTGQVETTAFRADLTINLGFLKTGCLLYPGQAYAGKNIVVDLGFPLHPTTRIPRQLLGVETLHLLPPRVPWGHKGTFGHVLVVGGSKDYPGAPALSGQAVLRGGAGLVTVAVPECIAGRFRPDELIVVPLVTNGAGYLGEESFLQLEDLLTNKNSLVIGPGLGNHPEVLSLVKALLEQWTGPTVIDADALRVLTEGFLESIPSGKRQQWIITPHPGEMARLIHSDAVQINQERLSASEEFAHNWGINVVLKGAPTIITNGEKTYINSTGNHGLGTAGTGDVLAGLIGSLLAQGLKPIEASCVGVYAHGAAGDLAAKQGARGLIASDCLKWLPEILA